MSTKNQSLATKINNGKGPKFAVTARIVPLNEIPTDAEVVMDKETQSDIENGYQPKWGYNFGFQRWCDFNHKKDGISFSMKLANVTYTEDDTLIMGVILGLLDGGMDMDKDGEIINQAVCSHIPNYIDTIIDELGIQPKNIGVEYQSYIEFGRQSFTKVETTTTKDAEQKFDFNQKFGNLSLS